MVSFVILLVARTARIAWRTDRQTDRQNDKPSTVTLAAHARRGLIMNANGSVSTNITKAMKTFFGLGSSGVFHGDLNPLSSSSIYETCVLPILLYGCETWLLDSSSLQALEKFQCEIGRRILKLPR